MDEAKFIKFIIRDEVSGLRSMLRSSNGAATRDNLLLACKDGTLHEEALKRACEHVDAAGRCLPLSTKAAFVKLHAHIKSASQYLEAARSGVDSLFTGEEGGPDADVAEATNDPEARQARSKGRAVAGVILAASGNADAAQRLVTSKPRTQSQ